MTTERDGLVARLRTHADAVLKPGGTNASDLIQDLREAADALSAAKQFAEDLQADHAISPVDMQGKFVWLIRKRVGKELTALLSERSPKEK